MRVDEFWIDDVGNDTAGPASFLVAYRQQCFPGDVECLAGSGEHAAGLEFLGSPENDIAVPDRETVNDFIGDDMRPR